MSFTRNKQDFTCEHCNHAVQSNGYTNHCPHCLWSKHVDIEPGDRKETCCGMMEPIDVEVDRDSYIITHRCTLCGATKRNHTSKEDNFEVVLAISTKAIRRS
ncbi:MAG: RNHCP domain-containing protein [Patescibacteria group bacterium]